MKLKQTAALAVLLILVAAPINAYAGDFYLSASIGNATLDEDFDGLVVDDNSTAFRVLAGWRFNDYFTIEGGYHDFGDFEETFDDGNGPMTATLSADGFVFGATGSIPVSERFALTGRAGMFFWNGTAEVNDVSQASPEDTNLYLGLGVSFDAGKSLQLTWDWTRYELDGAASGVFSVGLQYRFR